MGVKSFKGRRLSALNVFTHENGACVFKVFISAGNNHPHVVCECRHALSHQIIMLSYQIKKECMQASSKAY